MAPAAFLDSPRPCAGGTEVALRAGAAANLARSAWRRKDNGVLKKSGYDVAAPHPTLAGFGNGQIGSIRHFLFWTDVRFREVFGGAAYSFPEEQGSDRAHGGQLDFAHTKLHPSNLGAVANLRVNKASRHVKDVADSPTEMP